MAARKEKRPQWRLKFPTEAQMTKDQKALKKAISSGPRGEFRMVGPFAVYMKAPKFGILAQELGGYLRLRTSVPPRLSEFAILCTARQWRAQFEWYAHAKIAENAGISPKKIRALQLGRKPAGMKPDEAAIYDFVAELYAKKRVSDKNYARVKKVLGEEGTVELVGILGYYVLVAMTLNVFNAELPAGTPLFFPES